MRFILILLLLSSCGSDDSSSSDEPVSQQVNGKPSSEEPTLASISLETNADLPACEKANKNQLAYIVDEDTFYTCKDDVWAVIDIKGKDGVDGQDGSDGQDGISSNSSNLWHDSISGLDWLLGGPGTAWNADSACTGSYRKPTSQEGLEAAQHGIRAIAGVLSLNQDFWTGVANDASYIGLTLGVVAIKAGVTTDSRSIFCVKE